MKWVAISGSWRNTNNNVEEDVRSAVREIVSRGDGVITGGALNVDYFATDEVLKIDSIGKCIKVFLPTTLELYAAHYRKRAREGVITLEQANALIKQLTELKLANTSALIEGSFMEVTQEIYYERDQWVIDAADELLAFHVNNSRGVKDTMERAKKKGIPIKALVYSI